MLLKPVNYNQNVDARAVELPRPRGVWCPIKTPNTTAGIYSFMCIQFKLYNVLAAS